MVQCVEVNTSEMNNSHEIRNKCRQRAMEIMKEYVHQAEANVIGYKVNPIVSYMELANSDEQVTGYLYGEIEKGEAK